MKKSSLSFLILLMVCVSSFAENETITIQKWKPVDLTFETNVRSWRYCPTNPFEIDFYAEVTGGTLLRRVCIFQYRCGSGRQLQLITMVSEWGLTGSFRSNSLN